MNTNFFVPKIQESAVCKKRAVVSDPANCYSLNSVTKFDLKSRVYFTTPLILSDFSVLLLLMSVCLFLCFSVHPVSHDVTLCGWLGSKYQLTIVHPVRPNIFLHIFGTFKCCFFFQATNKVILFETIFFFLNKDGWSVYVVWISRRPMTK